MEAFALEGEHLEGAEGSWQPAVADNRTLETQVRALRLQLGLVAESLRREEGYSAAIVGLLWSDEEHSIEIAGMIARSAARFREQAQAAEWQEAAAPPWRHGQLPERAEALHPRMGSKEIAGALVAMLASDNVERSAGAAWCLADLIQIGEGPSQDCVDAGCIPPLLTLVKSGAGPAREAAAMSLEILSRDTDLHPVLVEAKCISAVTQALLAEGEAGKTALTRLLERFSRSEDFQESIVTAGGIAAAVQLLEDGKPQEQQLAAQVVGRLAEVDNLRDMLLQAPEVVPSLVSIVEDGHQRDEARTVALEALDHLVSAEVGQEAAQEAGAVPALLELVRARLSGSEELPLSALRVLNRMCQDSEMAEQVLEDGGLDILMELLVMKDADLECHEVAAQVLDQLIGGDEARSLAGKPDLLELVVTALRMSRLPSGQAALIHTIRSQVQKEEPARVVMHSGLAVCLSSILTAYKSDPSQWQVERAFSHGVEVEGRGMLHVEAVRMACKCVAELALHKGLVGGLHEGGVTGPLISLLRDSRVEDIHVHAAIALERMVLSQRDNSIVHDIATMGAAQGMFELLQHGSGGLPIKVALTAIRHMALHRANLQLMGEIKGGIELLVDLVASGNDLEKELAARALWNMAFLDSNHQRIAKGLTAMISLLESGTTGAKQAAAKALSILAVDDQYSQRLVAGGCIEPLVRMLNGSIGETEAAAGALANIAYDEESRRAIAQIGAIDPLMRAVSTTARETEEEGEEPSGLRSSLVEMACQCLENLAFSDELRPAIATRQGIPALLAVVRHGSTSGKIAALGTITNLATNDQRRLQIFEAGGIDTIVEALRASRTCNMKEASAKALWNLSYCDGNRAAIAEAGGIELLVEVITRGTIGRHAAARALWNLAYTLPNRRRIAAAGAVQPLVALLRSDNAKEQEAATKALVNLTLDEDIRAEISSAGAIQPLGHLLTSGSPTQRAAAARALTNLAMHSRNRADMEATGVVLPGLVRMLMPASQSMSASEQKEVRAGHVAAAKALRNIVADEAPRQAARDEGVVVALQALMVDENTENETKECILRVLEAMGEVAKQKRRNLSSPTIADKSSSSLAHLADKE